MLQITLTRNTPFVVSCLNFLWKTLLVMNSRSYCNFGVFPLQVALAWGIKHGVAVLPKSVSENHIKENLEALNVKLDDEDMKAIENIGIRHRYFKMHWIYNNKDIPKDLWDGED